MHCGTLCGLVTTDWFFPYKWFYLNCFSHLRQIFASQPHYAFHWQKGVALIHCHKGLADRLLLTEYKLKTTGKSHVASAKLSNLRYNGLPFHNIEQQQNYQWDSLVWHFCFDYFFVLKSFKKRHTSILWHRSSFLLLMLCFKMMMCVIYKENAPLNLLLKQLFRQVFS